MSFASLVKDIKPLPTLNLDLLTKKNKLPIKLGWMARTRPFCGSSQDEQTRGTLCRNGRPVA
jgi:hypothetical protein